MTGPGGEMLARSDALRGAKADDAAGGFFGSRKRAAGRGHFPSVKNAGIGHPQARNFLTVAAAPGAPWAAAVGTITSGHSRSRTCGMWGAARRRSQRRTNVGERADHDRSHESRCGRTG